MLSYFSHSVLISTHVVRCDVEPTSNEITIEYDMPDLAEVIRRGNDVPHVSDVNLIKVNNGSPNFPFSYWQSKGYSFTMLL